MLMRINYRDNDFWDCFNQVALRISESFTEYDLKELIEKHGITDFKNRIAESAYHFYIASKPFDHSGYFYRKKSYEETIFTNEHLLDYFKNTDVSIVKNILSDDWNSETVYIKFTEKENIVEIH